MTPQADPPFLLDALPASREAPEPAPGQTIGDFSVEAWSARRIALSRPPRPLRGGLWLGASAPLFVAAAFFLAYAEVSGGLAAVGALALAAGAFFVTRGARGFLEFPLVLDEAALLGRGRHPLLAPRRALPLGGVAAVEVRLTFHRASTGPGFVSAQLLVHDRAGRALVGPSIPTTTVAGWRESRDALLPLAREIARRAGAPLRLKGTGVIPAALLQG